MFCWDYWCPLCKNVTRIICWVSIILFTIAHNGLVYFVGTWLECFQLFLELSDWGVHLKLLLVRQIARMVSTHELAVECKKLECGQIVSTPCISFRLRSRQFISVIRWPLTKEWVLASTYNVLLQTLSRATFSSCLILVRSLFSASVKACCGRSQW